MSAFWSLENQLWSPLRQPALLNNILIGWLFFFIPVMASCSLGQAEDGCFQHPGQGVWGMYRRSMYSD